MKKVEKLPSGRVRVCTINEEPDLAQQQYKDACDVNVIMKKYEQTGVITHLKAQQGHYADLGAPADLLDAQMRVIRAQEAFMSLPAGLRAKCDHDASKFLKMLEDGSNDAELIKLGIIEAPKEKPSDGINIPPKTSDSAVGSKP